MTDVKPPILQERGTEAVQWLTVDPSGAAYFAQDYDEAVRRARTCDHKIYKRTTTISDWSEIVPVSRKGSSDD